MYPLTFYVDSLPPDVGGTANGPIIRILTKYRDDKGIYQHELEHVFQWLTGVLLGALVAGILLLNASPYWLMALIAGAAIHPLLYARVPQYKLWAEVTAYKEQAKHYDDDRKPLFAGFIANHYGLAINEADVRQMLL